MSKKKRKGKGKGKKARTKKAPQHSPTGKKAVDTRAVERREEEERRLSVERRRREERREDKERREQALLAKSKEDEVPELQLRQPVPPGFWKRHDLSVLFFALALFAGATLLSRQLATPTSIPFHKAGLRFERPAGWLPAQQISSKDAGLASTASGFGTASKAATPQPEDFHVIYRSARDAKRRIEVRIEARPAYRNLRGARAIDRLGQYGEFYWEAESRSHSIARRDWVRTEFRYAFKPSKSGSPQIANAVEYATIQDQQLYVVTLHDDASSMQDLDNLVSPTLRIEHLGVEPDRAEATPGDTPQ